LKQKKEDCKDGIIYSEDIHRLIKEIDECRDDNTKLKKENQGLLIRIKTFDVSKKRIKGRDECEDKINKLEKEKRELIIKIKNSYEYSFDFKEFNKCKFQTSKLEKENNRLLSEIIELKENEKKINLEIKRIRIELKNCNKSKPIKL